MEAFLSLRREEAWIKHSTDQLASDPCVSELTSSCLSVFLYFVFVLFIYLFFAFLLNGNFPVV
jgi:hypothetical protein